MGLPIALRDMVLYQQVWVGLQILWLIDQITNLQKNSGQHNMLERLLYL